MTSMVRHRREMRMGATEKQPSGVRGRQVSFCDPAPAFLSFHFLPIHYFIRKSSSANLRTIPCRAMVKDLQMMHPKIGILEHHAGKDLVGGGDSPVNRVVVV